MQVGADVFALRAAFSVLFFVPAGMLVNPTFLRHNIGHVAALTGLVVVGKMRWSSCWELFFPPAGAPNDIRNEP